MIRRSVPVFTVVLFTLLSACDRDSASTGVGVFGDGKGLSPDEIERGRMDPAWRDVVQLDTLTFTDSVANPEQWEDVSVQALNEQPTYLPLGGDVAGPSVVRVQVLLDRAYFSPGVIDGRWGMNLEKAVYWLQRREGLPATGWVDSATFARLAAITETPEMIVREHRLESADVEGPFVTLPEDIYAQAEMECMCYESLSEKLSELFHTSPELLGVLNPGVDLNSVAAGNTLLVPNVRDDGAMGESAVARIVVSRRGHFVHALDDAGQILYHFPSTLGSQYDPSPDGDYRVSSITEDPAWHYQPELLANVDPNDPDAIIPGGPNNAVGVIWMALSKPHYGIHGTSAPQTIGYTTSSGCVRLTNWDALFLGRRIAGGLPVEFRDG